MGTQKFEIVAGHRVGVIGGFYPTYCLWLHEWGEGFFDAAHARDEGGEILAIIEEPTNRSDDTDLWDFGEEERFQLVVREVLRGLDYGERKVGKMEVCVDNQWKEIAV